MTQPQAIRHPESSLLVVPLPNNYPTVKTRIPITFEQGAFKPRDAAKYLACGTTTLWRLTQSGKIRRTSYGTYPKQELDRHLEEEVKL